MAKCCVATPILVAWRSKVELCSGVFLGTRCSNPDWLIGWLVGCWLIDWWNNILVRAFTIPMHLSLINGPLCPLIWYQLRGSLILAKARDGPQTSNPNVLWAPKKELKYAFSFSLKMSHKTNPFDTPQQGPYVDSFPFTGPFLHIPQIHHKNFPR